MNQNPANFRNNSDKNLIINPDKTGLGGRKIDSVYAFFLGGGVKSCHVEFTMIYPRLYLFSPIFRIVPGDSFFDQRTNIPKDPNLHVDLEYCKCDETVPQIQCGENKKSSPPPAQVRSLVLISSVV